MVSRKLLTIFGPTETRKKNGKEKETWKILKNIAIQLELAQEFPKVYAKDHINSLKVCLKVCKKNNFTRKFHKNYDLSSTEELPK